MKECRDCNQQFAFTVGQQGFYKDRELSEPTRCQPCNLKNKAKMKSMPCDKFKKGMCTFGSSCRMAHGPETVRKPTVMIIEDADEGDYSDGTDYDPDEKY